MTGARSVLCQAKTRFLTGLVGRGILSSRSPWMHEAEAEAHGLRLIYSLFDFDARGWADTDLAPVLESAQRLGFAGLNVTFPFKQAVIPLLDALSDGARRIGAVNTVSFADGMMTGYNTDITGFAQSLANGLPRADLSCVLQIGCGGAGFATAHALLESGVDRILLIDADAQRRDALVAQLTLGFGEGRAMAAEQLSGAMQSATGVVNATPMGMAAFPGSPVPSALIRPDHWVADIVYFPLETQLLHDAAQKGCRTLNGSGMAVHQAAEAFDIFTGKQADRTRMLHSFDAFVPAHMG